MPLEAILWLALLVVLGVLFVVTLRRMSLMIARTRDLERFQAAAESLDRRFAASVEPLLRRLDDTRRHTGDPDALRTEVTTAQVTLAELVAEARAMDSPPGLGYLVVIMSGELQRAGRAADSVEHGLATLHAAGVNRDLEAQTALKRGALNLRHAREAFTRAVREALSLRPVDLAGRTAADNHAADALGVYSGSDLDDVDTTFDPRM